MPQIEAVFQNGVFRPLGDVAMTENQRVHLNFEPVEAQEARSWMVEVQRIHQDFIARRGYVPDTTCDIASDRQQ
jgi:predicted DNA-binding antitoxin AbrB/MazE fold protein